MLTNENLDAPQMAREVACISAPTYIDGRSLTVETSRANGKASFVTIYEIEEPASQYDAGEVAALQIGSCTRGFLVEFNDLRFLKSILPCIANRRDVFIDDDHGKILVGPNFVKGLDESTVLQWLEPDYAS
jgi:hypothetical protein